MGSLFRTGPGISKVDGSPCSSDGVLHISHWFDGLAHTHRFDIVSDTNGTNDIQIFYSSRRQCDKWVQFVQKNGLCDMITFAQKSDPCVGLFGKLMSSWRAAKPDRETKELENISITVQLDIPGLPSKANPTINGGHQPQQTVWLGTDAHMLCEVDRTTLEPLGLARQSDLHPALDGPCSCAHAERCPLTGDYFNVNIKPGPVATYKVFRVSAATNRTEIMAEIRRPDLPMAYIHSFFLSEHFLVLRVPSSHIKAYGLGLVWEKNILDAIVPFDEKNKCRWFVVDRVHGRGVVAEFETDAGFFFHTVNCFEETVDSENGTHKVNIICDVVEYPTMDIIHALYYDVLMNRGGKAKTAWGDRKKAGNSLPRLVRRKFAVVLPSTSTHEKSSAVSSNWSFNPFSWFSTLLQPSSQLQRPTPETVFTIHAPHIGELPTINPVYHTHNYRYVYSLAMSGRSTLVDSILKTDTVDRRVLQWNNPHGHTPGEAIFVARPGATKEDDGVLLSVVLDGIGSKSYLLCLDAQTMREVGKAEMDFAVSLGFHGVHTTNS